MISISYTRIDHPRYKYRVTSVLVHQLRFYNFGETAKLEGGWGRISKTGLLTIAENYCWNGANVVPDTMNSAAASAVHDLGYQMIAAGLLAKRPWKLHFDREFRELLLEGGMSRFRSQIWYLGVRIGGNARTTYNPEGIVDV